MVHINKLATMKITFLHILLLLLSSSFAYCQDDTITINYGRKGDQNLFKNNTRTSLGFDNSTNLNGDSLFTGIVVENYYNQMLAYSDSSFLKTAVKTFQIINGIIQKTQVEEYKKNYPDSTIFLRRLEHWTDTSTIQNEFDADGNLIGLRESWQNDSISSIKEYFFHEVNEPILIKQETKNRHGNLEGTYISSIGIELPIKYLKTEYNNGILVAIESDVCAFFNRKGKLITKEKFLNLASNRENRIYWATQSCKNTEGDRLFFVIRGEIMDSKRFRRFRKTCC